MSERLRPPVSDQATLWPDLPVRLLETHELKRSHRLLDRHHYLGSLKPVRERLYHLATDAQGQGPLPLN